MKSTASIKRKLFCRSETSNGSATFVNKPLECNPELSKRLSEYSDYLAGRTKQVGTPDWLLGLSFYIRQSSFIAFLQPLMYQGLCGEVNWAMDFANLKDVDRFLSKIRQMV